jgi:hypothetical protein
MPAEHTKAAAAIREPALRRRREVRFMCGPFLGLWDSGGALGNGRVR